ncbi:MAG: hypothetical protein CMC08_03310 [Flavobacteriaceae bacterium]|nr:hypothetical protein [Flavobacteriaceae bacterium]|tara:strand:- start:984 stop:1565 length:582 start_codon:yes stop_codon:yes gene_type:complete
MKKSIICIALSASVLCTSCLGSFSAFNNLKDWNMEISDSKFVNNLVFWGLNIIPVYGLFFLGDTIIFNVIEFWSGSNPIAMAEGEYETHIVHHDGNKYEMTATKNRMMVKVLEGDRAGERFDLVYRPSEKSWNVVKQDGEMIKISTMEEGMIVYHLPDGSNVKLDPRTSREEGLAQINSAVYNYEDCMMAVGN